MRITDRAEQGAIGTCSRKNEEKKKCSRDVYLFFCLHNPQRFDSIRSIKLGEESTRKTGYCVPTFLSFGIKNRFMFHINIVFDTIGSARNGTTSEGERSVGGTRKEGAEPR